MKTKLRLATFTMILFAGLSNAQTKTWDFGNDQTTWPESTGITTETVVDKLGLFPIATNTNFGAITLNNATFPDEYTATHRFQLNGGGGVTAPDYMPTQRYLYFDVDGACTVKVWFKTGSNGAARSVFVTDGTALVGSATTNTGDNLDLAIITANYTSATGGRLYVYGDGAASNLYKVVVSGANVTTGDVAGVDENQFLASANVFSAGKLVYVSNVISHTQLDIYSMTGALVKSVHTDEDMSLDFLTAGLYIANVKSAEGQKSVKLLVQ